MFGDKFAYVNIVCFVVSCFKLEYEVYVPRGHLRKGPLRPHYYYYYTKLLTFYQPKLSGKIQKGWWPGRHWHPPLRHRPATWPSIWCVKLWLRLKHCWQRLVDCVAGLCPNVRAVAFISTLKIYVWCFFKNFVSVHDKLLSPPQSRSQLSLKYILLHMCSCSCIHLHTLKVCFCFVCTHLHTLKVYFYFLCPCAYGCTNLHTLKVYFSFLTSF